MTSRTGSAGRILGDLKKSVSWVELSWVLPREKTVDFRLLAQALRREPHEMSRVQMNNARIERMCISLLMSKPLNSKVINGFVPELRSPVFRVSRFLCFMFICNEHSMSISHIAVSGYGITVVEGDCTSERSMTPFPPILRVVHYLSQEY